jgi:hypothetical protein
MNILGTRILLAVAVLILGTALPLIAPPAHAAGNVVISQIYGGGGGAGAVYKNDFVELYNRSLVIVDLGNWSIQYAAASGTSWARTSIPTSTLLGPGQYYLIAEAAGTVGLDLPVGCAQLTGTTAMSQSTGKVALCNNSTLLSTSGCPFPASVVDFVGYGTSADCSETSPAATLTVSTGLARKAAGNQDTDNNSQDFNVITPAPCALPTPARPTTWGVVKQIYR